MKTLTEWYRSTIWYNPRSVRISSNQVLAVSYHRTAATTYFVYLVWGILSSVDDDHYQDWFPFLIVVASFLAFIGANCFPSTGRIELFAASALTVLILTFIMLTLVHAVTVHPGTWSANLVLDASFLIIPVSRISFIIRQLLREASRSKK